MQGARQERSVWDGVGHGEHSAPGRLQRGFSALSAAAAPLGATAPARVPPGTPVTSHLGAIQTHRGGETVRWTGAPDSDAPAPRVQQRAGRGAPGGRHSVVAGGTLPRLIV